MTRALPAPSRPPAPLWRRGVAALLDSLIGLAAVSLAAMWLLLGVWALRGLPRTLGSVLVLYVAVLGLTLGFHAIYHVVFVGGCGQTLGRMALGIAVLTRGGQVPGYGRAALRGLGAVLNVLTLGLLSLPFLFSREGRGLADRLAGTRVVRVRGEPGPRGGASPVRERAVVLTAA